MLSFTSVGQPSSDAAQNIQTMRLRDDPPPITRQTKKRKTPPTVDQPQQQQQHVLPPPHALMHPIPGPLPPGYPYAPADYTPGGMPPGAIPHQMQQQQQQQHQQQQQSQSPPPSSGQRPLSSTKRAEQNRKAQRAFRERRDQSAHLPFSSFSPTHLPIDMSRPSSQDLNSSTPPSLLQMKQTVAGKNVEPSSTSSVLRTPPSAPPSAKLTSYLPTSQILPTLLSQTIQNPQILPQSPSMIQSTTHRTSRTLPDLSSIILFFFLSLTLYKSNRICFGGERRPEHVVVLDQDHFYVTFFVNIFVIHHSVLSIPCSKVSSSSQQDK